VLQELLDSDYLGHLQEVVVLGVTNTFADSAAPLHWRQTMRHSGLNVLALGILHETLIRFVPDPARAFAHGNIFTTQRRDPETGETVPVDIPDVLHVLTEIPGGARGIYHTSGVAHGGPSLQIHLYGSEGSLRLVTQAGGDEQLWGLRRREKEWREVVIPKEKAGGWRVEEEFIGAIRGEEPIRFTTFETGLRYMAFTEAVARSRQSGQAVEISYDEGMNL
jgi:predicted dehydrogenase